MVRDIVDRLFPLLFDWDNFEMIFGFVLAFLLGLWMGWGWAWRKIGISSLVCMVLYALGVWIEGSRSIFWFVIGLGAAALMPVLVIGMLVGKLWSARQNRVLNN